VKRSHWTAVLVALALMLVWAGAAQAQTTSNEPVTDDTTSTTVAGGDEAFCTLTDGLAAHSKISADTTSAHPSASVSFTVSEGCRIGAALASFDDNRALFDIDPQPDAADPTFGPGEHTLKVDLPSCAHFFAVFIAIQLTPDQPPALELEQAQHAAKKLTSQDTVSEPDVFSEQIEGDTKNCPTTTAPTTTAPTTTVPAHEAVPTTTVQSGGQLPFTGSSTLPMLIAALVLIAGGAAALLTARGRQAGNR
jgi:hypothetical protein